MTTLSQLITSVSSDIRDPSNKVWTTTEVTDMINAGIDDVGQYYPRELVDYSLAILAATYSYAVPSPLSHVFRVDVHNSGDSYMYTMPAGDSGERNTGWEQHAGILFLPPNYMPDVGAKLRLLGYGPYIQLSASTQTTDMDTSAQWAMRQYCQMEAYNRLITDRSTFQQWQGATNAEDSSLIALWRNVAQIQRSYNAGRNQLRHARKR